MKEEGAIKYSVTFYRNLRKKKTPHRPSALYVCPTFSREKDFSSNAAGRKGKKKKKILSERCG